MNVLQHFSAAFPGAVIEAELGVMLAAMPADSTCGDDCLKAIEAGRALLVQVRAAHGTLPDGELMARDCAAMVADICGVYIAG